MEFLTITQDDLPLLRSLKRDPRVMQHLGGVQSEEQIVRSHASTLEAIEQGGWCYKIVPEPDAPVAGIIVTWKTTWEEEPIHEMGWMVLPEFQGRGIASEAVRIVLDRARAQGPSRPCMRFQTSRMPLPIASAKTTAFRISVNARSTTSAESSSATTGASNFTQPRTNADNVPSEETSQTVLDPEIVDRHSTANTIHLSVIHFLSFGLPSTSNRVPWS